RDDAHLDERTAAECLQPRAKLNLQRSVITARGAHQHAAPHIELYLCRDVGVAWVNAKSAIARAEFIAGERPFEQLVHFGHATHFTTQRVAKRGVDWRIRATRQRRRATTGVVCGQLTQSARA